MPCGCSKQITLDDCNRLRVFHSIKSRTFIYFIKQLDNQQNKLIVREVKKGQSPQQVAKNSEFINKNGQVEFFLTAEHPCITDESYGR